MDDKALEALQIQANMALLRGTEPARLLIPLIEQGASMEEANHIILTAIERAPVVAENMRAFEDLRSKDTSKEYLFGGIAMLGLAAIVYNFGGIAVGAIIFGVGACGFAAYEWISRNSN